MKKTLLAAITVSAISAVTSFAQTSTSSFGQIPGVPNNQNPYAGSGIPYDHSQNTVISGLPGGDSVTLALAATANQANPAVTDNGAGTYFVGTGFGTGGNDPTKSIWNFDLYMSSASGSLLGYSFVITVVNVGNSLATAFDPKALGGNAGAPGALGNSERLDFGFLKIPLNYDANANDTYKVTLQAFQGGSEVGRDEISIVAGTGATPVPEPTTVIAGALMLLPFGFSAVRALRNRKADQAS